MELHTRLLLFSVISFYASHVLNAKSDNSINLHKEPQSKSTVPNQVGTEDKGDKLHADPNPSEQPSADEIIKIFLKNREKEGYSYFANFTNEDVIVMHKLAALYNGDVKEMLHYAAPIVLGKMEKMFKDANDVKFANDSVALAQTVARKREVYRMEKFAQIYCFHTMKDEIERVFSRFLELQQKTFLNQNEIIAFIMSDDDRYGAIYERFKRSSTKDLEDATDIANKKYPLGERPLRLRG